MSICTKPCASVGSHTIRRSTIRAPRITNDNRAQIIRKAVQAVSGHMQMEVLVRASPAHEQIFLGWPQF